MKSRLIIGLISWLIAAYLGYDLMNLYAQQELWGQRVLWFWLLIWGGFLAIISLAETRLPEANKLLLASCASGLLLGAGFMPMPTFFLMFVAFVPLLWVEDVVAKSRKESSKWLIFKYAFNTFLIWNILSTWWIQNSSFIAGMFGNTLNAIFMSIPFIFYHTTKKSMGQRAANIGFVSYWMTFEIGHLTWDLSWPWLTLGNSFAHLPAIVQWYEFTGVFGGSIWILGLNIWIANILFQHQKNSASTKLDYKLFYKPAFAFLLPILVSLGIYFMHNPAVGRIAEVVSVQPNYEPHFEKFSGSPSQQFADFIRLSQEQVTPKTAYLLFPETAFRSIKADKLQEESVIQGLKTFVQGYPNLNLVTGLSSYIRYQEGDKRPKNVYTFCNSNDRGDCIYIDSHNSAIQLNNESTNIPYYKKSKLVPGAESMPFIGDWEIFKSLILDLGGAPGLSLGIQDTRDVFSSKQGKVAPLICYESVYGNYVTDYIKNGAEALFVVTNDGWWDNTIGHRQHLYLSSLRAIENRRYVVRSANTGVSCFINSRGDIYHATNYNEQIAIRDEIYLRNDRTFYSIYGDLIGRVSILLTGWLLLSMLANGLRGKEE